MKLPRVLGPKRRPMNIDATAAARIVAATRVQFLQLHIDQNNFRTALADNMANFAISIVAPKPSATSAVITKRQE
jgi:hypothetical protein